MRAAGDAREILAVAYRALFPSRAELPWRAMRLLLAQSRGEGRWGELGGVDAAGDHYRENWGAVQAKEGPPCPPGTFEHGDSRPTAGGQVAFRWCFVGYSPEDPLGPVKGAKDFLRHALALRPRAHEALMSGSARKYARALYGNGKAPYFGGYGDTKEERIGSYVVFLDTNGAEVDRAFGLPPPPVDESSPMGSSSGGALLLGLGALAAGACLIWRK